jgi:hypothetical protein
LYELLVAALVKIGLSSCKHHPCVLTGRLVEGEPPLNLGIYVDDFTYFSDNNKVKMAFEQALSIKLQVT